MRNHFNNPTAAWFWFIENREANTGSAGYRNGLKERRAPCDPMDILNALNNVYQRHLITMDHILILRKYGRLGRPPSKDQPQQQRAHRLWTEGLQALGKELEKKGIVEGRKT